MWTVFRVEWEWIKIKSKCPAGPSDLALAERDSGDTTQREAIAALTSTRDVDDMSPAGYCDLHSVGLVVDEDTP